MTFNEWATEREPGPEGWNIVDAVGDPYVLSWMQSSWEAALRQQPNLSCPSVQKRLAAQWGYVKAGNA